MVKKPTAKPKVQTSPSDPENEAALEELAQLFGGSGGVF